MPIKERGAAAILISVFVLLAAIAGAVAVAKTPLTSFIQPQLGQNTNSNAPGPEKSKNPTLSAAFENSIDPAKLEKGNSFSVLITLSTSEPVNVVSTKIQYPKDLVKFKGFGGLGEPEKISMWISKKDLPETGFVQLAGAIPDPGLVTDGGSQVTIAKLDFEIISGEVENLIFSPTQVELLSNTTNKKLEGVVVVSTMDQKVLGTQTGGSLTLTPSTITMAPGCTFDLTLSYDSNGYDFNGIDAVINSDASRARALGIYRISEKQSDGSTFNPQLYTSVNSSGSIASATMLATTVGTDNKVVYLGYPKKSSMARISFSIPEGATDGSSKIDFKFDPANPQATNDSNIVFSPTQDILSKVSGTTVIVSKKAGCSNTYNATSTTTTQIASGSATVVTVSDEDADVNKDSKIDLSDISVILTGFNKKAETASAGGDLNKDGKINVLDFSLMVKTLVVKKVI